MSKERRRASSSRRYQLLAVSVAIGCYTYGSAPSLWAEPSRAAVTVDVDPPAYDGLQALLDFEARAALGEGDFPRAMRFFQRLLQIDPYDVRAMREAGRVANAMGRFDEAIEVLSRVDDLDGTVKDPEIHFLRAEALLALGRKDEAWREFGRTEQELGTGPHDRQGTMWLARIAVHRGDYDAAIRLYEPLLREDDPGSATYAEVLLAEVEVHIKAGHWEVAQMLLRDFLKDNPKHQRARELLAWCMESSGNIKEELALRAEFARDKTDRPQKTFEYARALERASEYSAALGRYREARSLGVAEASDGILRLERKVAPEVGGGGVIRTDPSGSVAGWLVGGTMPLAGHFRLALSAFSETSNGGPVMEQATSTYASGWGIWTSHAGSALALGATQRLDDSPREGLGGSAIAQTSGQRDVQLQVRGDMNVPWHESASVMRYDGVQDTVGGTLYLKSKVSERRVLASVGGQARWLGLEPLPYVPMDRARQLFASAGVDLTLSGMADRVVRGEAFDNEMLAPRSLTQATVVSYRHYEMTSDNPFPGRVVLVERSSIDELSGVIRHVFGPRGVVGAELRGGLGYDWVRYVDQWRAGASLLVAATLGSRLTFDYDVASESGTGLTGRRHLGSVVLHVDL